MTRLAAISGLVLLLFTLGCGNKGPLYLPQDPAETADTQESRQDR